MKDMYICWPNFRWCTKNFQDLRNKFLHDMLSFKEEYEIWPNPPAHIPSKPWLLVLQNLVPCNNTAEWRNPPAWEGIRSAPCPARETLVKYVIQHTILNSNRKSTSGKNLFWTKTSFHYKHWESNHHMPVMSIWTAQNLLIFSYY